MFLSIKRIYLPSPYFLPLHRKIDSSTSTSVSSSVQPLVLKVNCVFRASPSWGIATTTPGVGAASTTKGRDLSEKQLRLKEATFNKRSQQKKRM